MVCYEKGNVFDIFTNCFRYTYVPDKIKSKTRN